MTMATWAMLLTLFQALPSPTPMADYAATPRAREAAQAQPPTRPVLKSTADCYIAGNRLPGEGIFQCGARFYATEAARSEPAPTRSEAVPAPEPVELPPEALGDPHSYVLSQCSPLVLSSDADPALCEARVWAAIQAVRPDVGPRPAAGVIASGADDPQPPASQPVGARCRTVATQGEGSTGGMLVCGNNRAAEDLLGQFLK